MLLRMGSFPGFINFIQILCWIILPVLLFAVILTVWMHYRKRRKTSSADELTEEHAFLEASPEQVGYTNGEGEYILFDHSALIRKYKNRLTYNHARFTALQQDYNTLSGKFETLVSYAHFDFDSTKKHKTFSMENLQNDAVSHQPELVSEQEYLRDMLSEKKAQIDFLQSQLDQRIRQQHLSEQQRQQLTIELDQQRADALRMQEELDRWEIKRVEFEEAADIKDVEIGHAKDRIIYLENMLKEKSGQQEMLHAESADYRDQVRNLQQQLSDEQSRNQWLEQKLQSTKQAMKRLYKEFSGIMESESDPVPVISLRQTYIDQELAAP